MLEATGAAFNLIAQGDPELWSIIGLSLRTTLLSLLIASPTSIFVGYWLATTCWRGRRLAIWLIQTMLSMPTVLIGLGLYLMLSRVGPLGNLHWLFSQPGIVAGQVIIALPLLTALTLQNVQAIDPRLPETAITLGGSKLRVLGTVLNEARFGLVASLVHGFGRVISEVGCALMVGGNIAGETRTMTTAIALETSKGNFSQGIALGLVLMAMALAINGALLLLQGPIRTLSPGHS